MSEPLLTRTAKQMYREDPAVRNHVDWGSLPKSDQVRYERMASVALRTILGAPADEADKALIASGV